MNTENKKKEPTHNGWSVLYVFVGGLFNLINSGRIFIVFGVLLLGLVALIVTRVPAENLNDILIKILSLGSMWIYGFLISIIVILAILLRRSSKIYRSEIERLSKIRAELVHGISDNNTKSKTKTETIIDYIANRPDEEGGSVNGSD